MKICVNNLNDSLVFYRRLLNKMPETILPNAIKFDSDPLELVLVESDEVLDLNEEYLFQMNTKESFHETYNRMSRFMKVWTVGQHCEILDSYFTVQDPDGYKWLIFYGERPVRELEASQCFIERN